MQKSHVVQVSDDVYHELMATKHKLEKKDNCNFSFSEVIEYLLKRK